MIEKFDAFNFKYYNDDANLFNNQFHLTMKEGLIRSVDYDFFCDKLEFLLKSHDIIFELQQKDEYVELSIDISNVNRKKIDSDLTSFLHNTGYFKSSIIDNDGNKIKSILVSKHNIFKMTFQKRFDIPKNTPDILYHSTTEYYYNKIKTGGLTTKTQKMVSDDLERIYLTDNLAEALDFCTQKRFFIKDKYADVDMFNMNIDKWLVLEIDISSIPDIKLYEDPKMSNSYYTYDFIPSYAIRIKKSVDFSI